MNEMFEKCAELSLKLEEIICTYLEENKIPAGVVFHTLTKIVVVGCKNSGIPKEKLIEDLKNYCNLAYELEEEDEKK